MQAVADMLKTNDDLVKLGALRRRIRGELMSLDAKLRQSSKESLGSTRSGLSALMDSRVSVQEIQEQLFNVEKINNDPRNVVQGFDKLSEVSKIHKNFTDTLTMVDNLQDMVLKIEAIQDLLDEERNQFYGPQNNLIAIHYRLSQLEAFRNETIHQAKKSSDKSSLETLDSYFSSLAGVLTAFEEHYLALAGSLVELAKKGHANVAVKIAKIAELEGSRDEKAIAIRLVKKKGAEMASKFKSLQADARVIKHYRAKVVEAIRQSAKSRLQQQKEQQGSVMALLDNFDFFYKELVLVEDKYPSQFPPDWKIYNTFVKAYHVALYDMLKIFVASDEADAATLLRLPAFSKEYFQTMTGDLEISVDLLEPPLLDGKEQDLVQDYLKLIIKKLDEWASNLQKSEQGEFLTRASPPEEDADGLYGMHGSVILFEMINSQCDLAADSGQGVILANVVEECNRIMRLLSSSWSALIDQEAKKQLAPTRPEDFPDGLVEYVIALANDQVKAANFVETLLNRLETLVSEKYRVVIVERLNDSMDAFLDVAKKGIQVLIQIMFNDLKPATSKLFTSAWVSDVSIVDQVIETIQDYMSDFAAHLNPSLFELVVEDTMDTFLITYLVALKKASKLKMPAVSNRFKEDIRKAVAFFSQYKSKKELEAYFDVLDALLKILTASKTMFFLDYWPFAKRYGPNVTYIEALLKARDDFDRKTVNEVMEGIKNKVAEEQLPVPEQSIFSRLPVERSGLAGILPL